MKDFFSSPTKKRKKASLTEAKIFQISHKIKKELESGSNLGEIKIERLSKEELANLIFHIFSKGKFYVKTNLDIIKYFLNKYTKYGKYEGDKDFFLSKLGISMHVEKFPKDFLLFRKDDIGDKFYIILKGNVSIVIIQEILIEMSEKEYNIHLEKLRYYKEYNLLETILSYNNKLDINEKLLEMINAEIYNESVEKRKIVTRNSIKQKEGEPDINPEKFVQRVEPFIDKRAKEIKLEVKLPIYKIVATLKSGDTFGEVALSKIEVEERKRTATVITDTECMFGIVPNSIYSTFLKEVEEKNRYNLVVQLVSHSLFKKILPESFMKANYLNYFNIMTFKGGTYLFKQGEFKNSLFFITDGNINLYTETSIHNIIKVIEHLKEEISYGIKVDIDINTIKKDLEEELDIIREYHSQNKINSQFNKFCKIKRIFKIYNINKKETLGFDDCLFKDEKFFTTAKIMSDGCKVFVLKINFLNALLKENVVLRNYYRTNFEKKILMIKRLTTIIRMLINQFFKKYKVTISIPEYSTPKKKIDTKILKSKNISFEVFKNNNENKNNNRIYSLLNLKINKIPNKSYYISKQKNQWKFDYIDKYLFKRKNENEKNQSNKITNEMTTFKNKLLKIHINFSNENIFKNNKFILPKVEKNKIIERIKRKKNKTKEKYKTEIIKFNSEDNINTLDINKVIPKMEKLSSKLMIDEYNSNRKQIKNMSQYDFIFYEHFFTNQGNKQYCEEPLIYEN